MRRLWRDVQAHKRGSVLLLLYWLATLAVARVTWSGGLSGWVVALLLTTPLIAGALVGRWRASTPERAARSRERLTGGVLAGVLIAALTLLVTKGGMADELIGWMHGDRFRGGEVIEFCLASGVLGVLLGLAGAVLAIILDRVRRKPALST